MELSTEGGVGWCILAPRWCCCLWGTDSQLCVKGKGRTSCWVQYIFFFSVFGSVYILWIHTSFQYVSWTDRLGLKAWENHSFSHSFNRHLLDYFYWVDTALVVRGHKSPEHWSCENSAPVTVQQHGERTVLESGARATIPGKKDVRDGHGLTVGGGLQLEQTSCGYAPST